MPFADAFLRGIERGRGVKERRIQEEFAKEDREIERDILQQRLRELKINERLQARQAAMQNIGGLEGQPESAIPESQLEGIPSEPLAGVLTSRGVTPTPQVQQPLQQRPVSVPGVPELGVEGFERRPLTFEELFSQDMARRRLESLIRTQEQIAEPRVVPSGGTLTAGGQEIFRSEGRQRGLQTIQAEVEGVAGRQRVTFDPDSGRYTHRGEDVTDRVKGVQPQSLAGLGDTAEDATIIADMVERGDMSPILTGFRGTTRARIASELGRRNFNLRAAERDAMAMNSHIRNLNTAQVVDLRAAAANARGLLEDIDAASKSWQEAGVGPRGSVFRLLNRASLNQVARGRVPGTTPEQQQLAVDLLTSIEAFQEALAEVRSGGSTPTNAALDRAAATLSSDFSQGQLQSTLKSLDTHLTRRVASITNLDPVLAGGGAGQAGPTEEAPPTANQVAAALAADGRPNDAATVQAVMNSPEAMAALFGQ